jgi:hypothetical protein
MPLSILTSEGFLDAAPPTAVARLSQDFNRSLLPLNDGGIDTWNSFFAVRDGLRESRKSHDILIDYRATPQRAPSARRYSRIAGHLRGKGSES